MIGGIQNKIFNYLNEKLVVAIFEGDVESATRLLLFGAEASSCDAQYGYSALHLGAVKGDVPLISLSINRGANVNLVNNEGQTPLHLATLEKKIDAVKFLMQKNPDVARKNNRGETVLHISAELGFIELVRLFLDAGLSVNEQNEYGKTALHLAIDKKHNEIAELLINQSTDLNIIDNYGSTALHAAAKQGCDTIVDKLIKAGAELNIIDELDGTPLHAAVANDHLEIVKMLLLAKVDVNAVCRGGWSVLFAAAERSRIALLNTLVRSGANLSTNTNYDRESFTTAFKNILLAFKNRADILTALQSKVSGEISLMDINGVLCPLGPPPYSIILYRNTLAREYDVISNALVIQRQQHIPFFLTQKENRFLDYCKQPPTLFQRLLESLDLDNFDLDTLQSAEASTSSDFDLDTHSLTEVSTSSGSLSDDLLLENPHSKPITYRAKRERFSERELSEPNAKRDHSCLERITDACPIWRGWKR